MVSDLKFGNITQGKVPSALVGHDGHIIRIAIGFKKQRKAVQTADNKKENHAKNIYVFSQERFYARKEFPAVPADNPDPDHHRHDQRAASAQSDLPVDLRRVHNALTQCTKPKYAEKKRNRTHLHGSGQRHKRMPLRHAEGSHQNDRKEPQEGQIADRNADTTASKGKQKNQQRKQIKPFAKKEILF